MPTIPNIDEYTGNVPVPGQPQPDFNQNTADQLAFMNQLPTQMNPSIDAINQTASEIETSEVNAATSESNAATSETNAALSESQAAFYAQQSADNAALANGNYAGEFISGATSATAGETYLFDGVIWLCLSNTTTDPARDNSAWKNRFDELDAVAVANNTTIDNVAFLYDGASLTGQEYLVYNAGVFRNTSNFSGVVSGITNNGSSISCDIGTVSTVLYKASERVFPTLQSALTSTFRLGDTVRTLGYFNKNDGGGALYEVNGSGSDFDGFVNHQLADGRVLTLVPTNPLIAAQCGVVAQDKALPVSQRNSVSDALDAIVSFFAPEYTQANRRPQCKAFSVNLGSEPLRITRPFYQPAFTYFYQEITPTFAWDGVSSSSVDETFIYADVDNGEKLCAWNYAGWWLSDVRSAVTGDRLNPFNEIVESADYNNGDVSLTYGADCKINLYTDKFVGCGINVTAATSSRFDVQCRGFLHPIMGNSCWDVDGTIHALSHHSGGYFYNCNSWKIKGYTNYLNDVSAPEFNATSSPESWFTHPIHNPPSLAYLTTGLYHEYCNGFETSITTEGWDRARLGSNNVSIVEIIPYIEGIATLGIQCVNSDYKWIGGSWQMLGGSTSLVRPSGSSSIILEAPHELNIDEMFSGTVDPVYTTSSVLVKLRNPSLAAYSYSDFVKYEFTDGNVNSVYVSSAGSDSNEGLDESYPILTINEAIDRLKRYNIKNILIDLSGSDVTFSDYAVLNSREINISGYNSGNAGISPLESSGTMIGFRLTGNNAIKVDGVDLVGEPSSSPTPSAAGVIRLDGGCLNIHLINLTSNMINGASLIGAGSNSTCAVINFASSNSTFNGNIGINSAAPQGAIKVVIASVDDLSAQFGSIYTLI